MANKSSSAASINEEDSLQVSRTFAEAIEFRNKLYDENKKKQLSRLVPRLEKIEVSAFNFVKTITYCSSEKSGLMVG